MAEARSEKIAQHQLYTARLLVWRALRKANKIPKKYKSRVKEISAFNRMVSILAPLQRWMFNGKIKGTSVDAEQPIFILGHWRSGTTHLQYMIAEDPRLGYLSNYQAMFFTIALVTRSWLRPILAGLFPKIRPMDNVQMSADKPGEEEQALGAITARAGIHSLFFPQNQSYMEKFTLFKGISEKEKKAWKSNFLYVVKSIAYYNGGKPLVLKNPYNTSRIKALLELFPNAKFIFPHRDPYDIYRSTVHLYQTVVRSQMLQECSDEEIEDKVIYIFREMMKIYLVQRQVIPKGNLVEIAFGDLEKKPMDTLAHIYQELHLPGYDAAAVEVEKYLNSIGEYKKNQFPDLPADVVSRINEEWGFFFEAFGYGKRDAGKVGE